MKEHEKIYCLGYCIYYCEDCIYYSRKKHERNRGAIQERKPLDLDDCYHCLFWDSDYKGCTCPPVDEWKWYACPLEPELTEEDFMTVEVTE